MVRPGLSCTAPVGITRTDRHGRARRTHAGAGARQAPAHPLCTAIERDDLRQRELSTVSTDAMTPTNLYMDRSLRRTPHRPSAWGQPALHHPTTRVGMAGFTSHGQVRVVRPCPDRCPAAPAQACSQACHPGSTAPRLPSTEEPAVKFRVERDVFADAVAWAARSLPVRPSAPVLAGPPDRGQRRGPGALDLRLRDVGPRRPHGRGQRRRQRPGQRPAARRHLPQPAQQAGRRACSRAPRSSSPAAPPASASRPCRSRTTPSCPRCRPPPAPSPATTSPTPSPRP